MKERSDDDDEGSRLQETCRQRKKRDRKQIRERREKRDTGRNG